MEFNHLLSAIVDLPNLKLSTFVIPKTIIKLSPIEYYKLAVRKRESDSVIMPESEIILPWHKFYRLVGDALDLPGLKIDDALIVMFNIVNHVDPDVKSSGLEAALLSEEIKSTQSALKLSSKVEPEVKLPLREFNTLLSNYMYLFHKGMRGLPLLTKNWVRLPLKEFDHFLSVMLDLPNLKVGTLLMTQSEITLSFMEYRKLSSRQLDVLPSKSVDWPKIEFKLSHKEFYDLVTTHIEAQDLKIGTFHQEPNYDMSNPFLDGIPNLPDLKIGDFSKGSAGVKWSLMEFHNYLSKYIELCNAKKISDPLLLTSEVKLSLMEFNHLLSQILDLPYLKLSTFVIPETTIKLSPIEYYKLAEGKKDSRYIKMPESDVELSQQEFYGLVCGVLDLPDLKIGTSSKAVYKTHEAGSSVTEFRSTGSRSMLRDKSLSEVAGLPTAELIKIQLPFKEYSKLLSKAIDLSNEKLITGFEITLSLSEFNQLLSIILELPNSNVGTLLMTKSEITLSPLEYYKLEVKYQGLGNAKIPTSEITLSYAELHEKICKIIGLPDLKIDVPSIDKMKNLEKYITTEMYEKNIDVNLLSSLDEYGLRKNTIGDTFLKIKDGYIKIKKLNENRFLLGSSPSHRKMVLRYKNDQFFVETTAERLQNIVDVKSSGVVRRIKDPIGILGTLPGFTRKSAAVLLFNYQFPEIGFYNMYSFALQIEQTGEIPVWAERFKKTIASTPYRSEIIETIALKELKSSSKMSYKHLGSVCHKDESGTVFLDADDTRFVIKRFYQDKFPINFLDKQRIEENVIRQSEDIISYYGAGSATVFRDDIGNYYIRMYNLPGKTIESLEQRSLPVDAVERFIDMLEKMDENEIGILHEDLNSKNVFWDSESQIFYPLVFSREEDNFEKFLSSLRKPDPKKTWDEIIECIKDKMEK